MSKNYKNVLIGIVSLVLVIACGLFSINKIGIKDGAMFTASLVLTVVIIVLAKKEVKKAIYLFIIAMPILVTARKLFYLDLIFLKLNFESLIIIVLFVFNFNKIKDKISKSIESNKSSRWILYSIILFVLSSYISVIFSTSIVESLQLTTTSIMLPTILLAIIVGVFEKNDIKNIIYSLVICVNFSCLYGFMQAVGVGLDLQLLKESREYVTYGYHNSNIFVIICMMVYPLLLNELLYKKNSVKEKIFLIISILLQSGAMFITFSRGAWLTLAMVCVAILFSKKYKFIFAGIFILGLVASPFVLPKIMSRGESNEHFLQNTSNTARVQSIVTSVEIIKNNPYGVGFGEFNKNFREYVVDGYLSIDQDLREKMSAPLYSLESAHNFFLNTGVELGALALISIIVLLILKLKECVVNYSDNRAPFIAISMFIFLGLTTGIEINHKGVLTNTYIFWILLGLIYLNNNTTLGSTDNKNL